MGQKQTRNETFNEMSKPSGARHEVSVRSLCRPAIFDALEHKRRILIGGCGGGFDIFAGLPLYFSLKSLEVEVFLGNLSFTALRNVQGARPTECSMEVSLYMSKTKCQQLFW